MSVHQSSIFSLGSGRPPPTTDEEFDDMTDEELQHTLEDMMQRNWVLGIENDLFQRYLLRNDPQSLKTTVQMLDRSRYAKRYSTQIASKSPRKSMRMSIRMSVSSIPRMSSSIASFQSGSRYGTQSMLTSGTLREGLKITLPHRMKMLKEEVQILKRILERSEEKVLKKKALLRAEIEELEIRVREAHQTQQDFEENVINKGVDPMTKKIPAEKIVRFVEEWLKTAESILERLRLKTTGLKLQITKTKVQLSQREELGESLRAIDFQQLHIENSKCIREIEEKTLYLLKMKKIAGHYSLQLTRHKQKLNDQVVKIESVREEIATKQQQIKKLESESVDIKIDVEKQRRQLTSLMNLMENYSAPDILDYVKVHAEYQELQKTYRTLCRRKKIEEIKYNSKQNYVPLYQTL